MRFPTAEVYLRILIAIFFRGLAFSWFGGGELKCGTAALLPRGFGYNTNVIMFSKEIK